jgi:hypothetical protein
MNPAGVVFIPLEGVSADLAVTTKPGSRSARYRRLRVIRGHAGSSRAVRGRGSVSGGPGCAPACL